MPKALSVPNSPSAPRHPRGATVRAARSANLALLVFVVASLTVTMSVGQEDEIEVGSLAYWLLILPAALLPLVDAGAVLRNLLGPGRILLAMVALGGAWHVAGGDIRAAVQLALLAWVLAWVSSTKAILSVRHTAWLFLGFVAIGACVDLLTDMNPWGLLPGRTDEEYGIWRISFFPNIANTGLLSFFVLLLLTRDRQTLRRYAPVAALALYFLLLSFVRTAIIGAFVYVALRWWFDRPQGPRGASLAWISGLVAVSIILFIASSAIGLAFAQDFPLISRLLLRGEAGLTPDEIFQQLYRPWLWGQHLMIFTDSPMLMGRGVFEFAALQSNELVEGHPGIGSDALPTRLLAAYGLAGVLFTAYLLARLRTLALADDRWACAVFPAIFVLMMHWGSVFHPSNAFFAFFLLVATRGSRGIVHGR